MTSLWDAKRRAVRLSGSSSRVRSAGATQGDTLASAATAIGAIANKLPSASAPVTKTEQIVCRMRGPATPIGTYAERPRFLSITDFCRQSSLGPQRGGRKLTSSLLGGTVARANPSKNLGPSREFLRKLIFTELLRSAQRDPGEMPMASTDVTAFQLSPAEHQVQLRRAVTASATVATIAVAPITPMPGIASTRWLASLEQCCILIRFSCGTATRKEPATGRPFRKPRKSLPFV